MANMYGFISEGPGLESRARLSLVIKKVCKAVFLLRKYQ